MVDFPFNYKATFLIVALPKRFQKDLVAFFLHDPRLTRSLFLYSNFFVKIKHPHPSLGFNAIERSLKPKKCQKWSKSHAQAHQFLKYFLVLLMDDGFMIHGVEPTLGDMAPHDCLSMLHMHKFDKHDPN